jgi:hypothetical protein
MVRLLRMGAPDLAALAVKVELVVAEQVWELVAGEACLAALVEDVRGFAGG